jgi:hypothetical protein
MMSFQSLVSISGEFDNVKLNVPAGELIFLEYEKFTIWLEISKDVVAAS